MCSLSAAPTVTKSARSAAAATAAADPQCRLRPQVAVMWRSPSWRSTTWGLRPWRRSSPTSTQTARPASTRGTQSHSSKQQTPTPYQGSRRTANIICQVSVVRPCLVRTSIDLGPKALHMIYIHTKEYFNLEMDRRRKFQNFFCPPWTGAVEKSLDFLDSCSLYLLLLTFLEAMIYT